LPAAVSGVTSIPHTGSLKVVVIGFSLETDYRAIQTVTQW
jgi:hypothetical protein